MDATQRKLEIQTQQAAALVKLDRNLYELERFGAARIRATIDAVADDLDLDALKSIVFDIEAALATYERTKQERRRLS